MKRSANKELSSCHDCDFLESEDGFSHHHMYCPLVNKVSQEITDSKSAEEAEAQMKEWFEKECPFPKEQKVYNVQLEAHQIEVLEKIKKALVQWQNYNAAHHVREAIKLIKEKLEVPKNESTTTVYKLEKGPGEHEDISFKT